MPWRGKLSELLKNRVRPELDRLSGDRERTNRDRHRLAMGKILASKAHACGIFMRTEMNVSPKEGVHLIAAI